MNLVEEISKTKRTINFQENILASDVPDPIKRIYRRYLTSEKKFLEDAQLLLQIMRTKENLKNKNGGVAQG